MVFLRRFRDPIRIPRIRENYHRVPKIRENRVPRIREIGSLQIQIGFLTFSLKKTCISSSRSNKIKRMENSGMISTKRNHSRLAESHMADYYLIDEECENRKQLFDSSNFEMAQQPICDHKILRNHFNCGKCSICL